MTEAEAKADAGAALKVTGPDPTEDPADEVVAVMLGSVIKLGGKLFIISGMDTFDRSLTLRLAQKGRLAAAVRVVETPKGD